MIKTTNKNPQQEEGRREQGTLVQNTTGAQLKGKDDILSNCSTAWLVCWVRKKKVTHPFPLSMLKVLVSKGQTVRGEGAECARIFFFVC